MPPPRRTQRRRPVTLATVAGALSLVLPCVSLVRLYLRTGSLLPALYIGVTSTVAFVFYGVDKMQARNLEWRVKETTLHTLAIIGGWPGALVGMHFFQHKTRKAAFQVPFWIILMGWQVVSWTVCRTDFSVEEARRAWSVYN